MHHFIYQDSELNCESVPVKAVAEAVKTPFYLYSHATLVRHFEAFHNAFEGIDRLICYSAKANSNQAVLKLFADLGGGLDIVSGGELYRGLQAGYSPERIVYSGVGKRADEIDYALETSILMFNVESVDELTVINERAGRLGKTAPVAIRVNPDVDPKTHPYISTGLQKNKFGVDVESAIEGYKYAHQLAHLEVVGIDCHIGSQITEATPFKDALKGLLALIDRLQGMGIPITYLDVGGGLGIVYEEESPPLPDEYARTVTDMLHGSRLQLILEPGRVIVGNAGALVTRVLYRKQQGDKEFVVVDAAMNDLLRPALYDAYHAIWPVKAHRGRDVRADIVGPICESSDFLAVDRRVPDVRPGDLLAVMSAGAYGFVMSSNYCSRLRIAEVMVKADDFHVIRKRETYPDLIANESMPPFLG